MGIIWMVAVVAAMGTIADGCIPSPYYQQAYMPYGGGGMPYAAAASKSRMASDTHTYVGNSLDPFHAPPARSSGASKPHRDTNDQSLCVQQRFSNQRLECAASVERRVPLSAESECQRLCLESLLNCRAYQFDSIGMACDLYDELTVSRLFPSSVAMPLHDQPSSPFEQEAVADDGDTADLNSYKQRHRRFTLQNGVESAGGRRGGSSAAFSAPAAAVPQADSLLSSLFPQPSATAFAAPAATAPAPNSLLSSLFPQPSATASSPSNNPLDPLGFGNLLKSPLLNLPPPGPCEPKLQMGIGSTVVVVNPDCTLLETPSSLFPSPEPSPPVFLGGVEPFSKHSAPHVSIPTNYASNSVDVLPETETSDCVDGSRARVQLIDGISLVEERTIAKIQLDTAEVCLHLCRSNAHLDGNRFPRTCKAATFDRASGRCSIVDEAISPNGELNYVPNPDSVYFEKICIPDSELPTGCDEVINRIPQHTLDSRAAGTGAVISTKSQIECIRRCVTAQRQLGFECASASFFFDWRTDNCYLSRFTRLNRPDIYVAERRQLVDYMELPTCMRRGSGTWQHDDVTAGPWSSWSECDATTMTRSRHRNCSSCHTVEKSVCSSSNRDLRMDSPKQVTAGLPEKKPKKIATTLEDAKRLKPAAGIVTPDQASLFGEQDYEQQAEVSYFGPPHKPTTNQPDGTVGSLKTAGPAHPLKSELGVKKNPAPSTSSSSASSFTAADSKKCDSTVKCCPQANELKAMVWGCSVGVKTLSDGRNVPCLTEECH